METHGGKGVVDKVMGWICKLLKTRARDMSCSVYQGEATAPLIVLDPLIACNELRAATCSADLDPALAICGQYYSSEATTLGDVLPTVYLWCNTEDWLQGAAADAVTTACNDSGVVADVCKTANVADAAYGACLPGTRYGGCMYSLSRNQEAATDTQVQWMIAPGCEFPDTLQRFTTLGSMGQPLLTPSSRSNV